LMRTGVQDFVIPCTKLGQDDQAADFVCTNCP
jgi:hypothetical protein